MKKKAMRRALITSIISLMLCVSMLVGTTFAWFTDEAASANNIIKSGNLDVVLEYWDGDSYEEVTSTTKLFNDAALWEPGYTEVAYLKVSNAGSLALKYLLSVNVSKETPGTNVANEPFNLSDYLEFKVVESESDLAGTYTRETAQNANATATKLKAQAYSSADKPLENNGDADYVALIVYMPTTVGNEANYKTGTTAPSIELGVNLLATQYTYEKDSFDDQYDAGAGYPGVITYDYEVSDLNGLKDAITKGGNIQLTGDVALTGTLMPTENVLIDLNGNTITASSGSVMFQSQSNAGPDITITSSTPGAEINVTGGDTSVLLGYGKTEIKNVTINVEGGDNYSPNPFKAFGDLTLGEGTVVNIDYLGTALISNNGAHAIVIDGAEINIGTFKKNGAMIELNAASTLVMKNTTMKIEEFVRSQFGGDCLVNKVAGVTIDNCTFDVTDSNGKKCTFEADTVKNRYSLVQI